MIREYRKKPKVIHAFQFTEEMARGVLFNDERLPWDLSVCGSWNQISQTIYNAYVNIRTLEGRMKAGIGDYIIKGIQGELYPCKPDIFEESYEGINNA